ncbi:MAG: CIS tube protein [Bacteroidia bacterium]
MSILDGKLSKLTFIFYLNPKAPGLGVPYTPMYNPTSFSVSHKVAFDKAKKPLVGDNPKKIRHINPRTVSMKLFFDGTGASPSASRGVGANSAITRVDLQVEAFLKLAYQIDGTKHRPHYVMVVWGSFLLTGVLTKADVSYTMFAADGSPLRAEMDISIEESIDNSLLGKILGLLSPDLSKSIIVKEGDTLPLLCFQEYQDASLYTKVAKVNNLKNYRKLKQGMELLFPPINNLV